MTRAHAAPVTIEILIQSRRWQRVKRAPAIIRRALEAAASEINTAPVALAVVLTHDKAIRELNRQWRGFDKPTNVLSFPSLANERTLSGHIGDIVIAYETMAREAKDDAKMLSDHLAHMAVHGFLHLAGFDHETAREANRMERLERKILAGLGIADPYAARPADDKKPQRQSR